MSGLPGEAAMAGWLRLSAMQGQEGLGHESELGGVHKMSTPGFFDGRHSFPRYSEAPEALVPCNLVCDFAEIWSECASSATDPGIGKLCNGLDLAT